MANKTVLITGSSRGLGRALARVFSEKEFNVILHGRNEERLEAVKKDVLCSPVECEIVSGDLASLLTIGGLFDVATAKGLDVFVNNAGVYLNADIITVEDGEIREMIETNFIAPMLLTKRIFGWFNQKGKGTVININSIAGKNPSKGESIYCASKHGLRGFMGSLQFEAKGDVRIIDVYLGAMKTDMTKGREDFDEFMKPLDVAYTIFGLLKARSTVKITEINIARKNY